MIARQARLLEATKPEPFAVPIYGPPAGRDEYRARNVQLLRTRIADAKQDRNVSRKAGEHRRADVLQQCIEGWQRSIAELGL